MVNLTACCLQDIVAGLAAANSGQVCIGDVVLAIDDQPIDGWELDEIERLVNGWEGTHCKMALQRRDYSFAVSMLRVYEGNKAVVPTEFVSSFPAEPTPRLTDGSSIIQRGVEAREHEAPLSDPNRSLSIRASSEFLNGAAPSGADQPHEIVGVQDDPVAAVVSNQGDVGCQGTVYEFELKVESCGPDAPEPSLASLCDGSGHASPAVCAILQENSDGITDIDLIITHRSATVNRLLFVRTA